MCLCPEMGYCGTTAAEIPFLLIYFFFKTELVESFGEADAFLDTCQLLKGLLWFSAAQLPFKSLQGKVIVEGIISDQ